MPEPTRKPGRPSEKQQDAAQEPVKLVEGEDYYYEGPYMVFTAKYHLKRGSCCNSGCRHCPYREA